MTKKKRLVLVCVVALAMFSIALVCSCVAIQGIHYGLCNRRLEANGSSDSLTLDFRVLGDPIDDPKPNSYKEIVSI